jgi:hypothetical protein
MIRWTGALAASAVITLVPMWGQAGYVVDGVVVNNTTSQPMNRVRVAIAPASSLTSETEFFTAADGKFHFEGVAAGRYRLTAEPPGRDAQVFGRTAIFDNFTVPVVVGEGKKTDNLVFRYVAPSAIHGRVLDENGDPVRNAPVQLLREAVVRGHKAVRQFAGRNTDDEGQYRFPNMTAGTFYVAVSGRPWYADVVRSADSKEPLAKMGFSLTYYPGTRDPRAAKPVVLRSGEDLAADFLLAATPTAIVTLDFEGSGQRAVRVDVMADSVGDSKAYERVANGGGGVTLTGMAPGSYLLRAKTMDDSSKMLVAEQPVTVGGTDQTVTLTMHAAPSIAGAVKRAPGDPPLPQNAAARLENLEDGRALFTEMGTDGKFFFDSVFPGSYRINFSASGRVMPYRGLLVDGQPPDTDILDVTKPMTVEAKIDAGGGSIVATVLRGGEPVTGALLEVAPAKEAGYSYELRALWSGSDGSAEFPNLPAGDYVVFAVEKSADFEWAEWKAVRPRMASGQTVHLDPGKQQTVKIEL